MLGKELYIYEKDKLDDILSCAICLEYYKHPRNLLCGHSFCTTCLRLIQINNEIVCPLCRHITSFHNTFTMIDLSVNTTLTSFIDDHIKINNKKVKLKRSKSMDIIYKTKRKKKKSNRLMVCEDEILNNEICREKINECCSFQ